MIRTDGETWPWPRTHLGRKAFRLLFRLRERLGREVEIDNGGSRFRFRCHTRAEFSRCLRFFAKEPGTCDWIRNTVKPGQVFYDIGANIGIYTLLAADRVGNNGRVYAFEPHSANFTRLLDNIAGNGFEETVVPCNFALHHEAGFFPFNYRSSEAATAESQLDSARNATRDEFQPVVSELKYASSIDHLVKEQGFAPPHHVKIDVDGNELLILRGMSALLQDSQRPTSIQVEINPPTRDSIPAFMAEHGYRLCERHHTRRGQELIDQGEDPGAHSWNAVFRPAADGGTPKHA